MSADSINKEAQLKHDINQKLEEYGFLANIRSQIRTETLQTARNLANEGKIKKTKELERVNLTNDEDPALIAVVRELLDYLNLTQTKEMLDLELDESIEPVDLKDVFQQFGDDNDKRPYLLKLIQRCRERHIKE